MGSEMCIRDRGLAVAMTLFLFSLAGLPPVGGWLAKWRVFESLLWSDGGGPSWQGVTLAVVAAINSVVAAYYYLNVAKYMWFMPAADGDE